jgi:putative ABC transport system permease protein
MRVDEESNMPEWKDEIKDRLASLNLDPAREAEIVEELAQHLNDRYAELRSSGATDEEASGTALAELNDGELLERELRRVEPQPCREPVVLGRRRVNMIGDLWQDLRYGWRTLRKNPGFTIVAALTLALGIGVNTAIFTFFDLALLRPLPVKEPETLVNLEYRGSGGYPFIDYTYLRYHTQVFSDLIASRHTILMLGGQTDSEEPQEIEGEIVSNNYFSSLGGAAILGRTFTPEENRWPGEHPLVVLSYAIWQGRFGADPEILGKTVRLNNKPFVVIGVMAPGFVGLGARRSRLPDVWLPVMMAGEVWPQVRDYFSSHKTLGLILFGRLKPGRTISEAQAEMTMLHSQLASAYPEIDPKAKVIVNPLGSLLGPINTKGSKGSRWVVLGSMLTPTLIVLLIACSNIANLQLARAAGRQKEIGVRLCLGASRSRVIRQLLTESILLAVLGGGAGLLLAWWILKAFLASALSFSPMSPTTIDAVKHLVNPDLRILSFTLLLSFLSAIAFGLVPALHATRSDLVAAIKDEGLVFSQRMARSRLRNGLVVAQVSLCLVLLIAAGLLLRGFIRAGVMVEELKTGNLLFVHPGTQVAGYDESRSRRFCEDLAARLDGSPGVQAVTMAHLLPRGMTLILKREDGRQVITWYHQIAPNYFDAVGAPIVRGRGISEAEARAGAPVVVVTEATAQKLWPDQEPVGKNVMIYLPPNWGTKEGEWILTSHQVVGVARDALGLMEPNAESEPLFMYTPLPPQLTVALLVRTSREAKEMKSSVRSVSHTIDPTVLLRMSFLEDYFEVVAHARTVHIFAVLAVSLGLLALSLAAVGLYGVMAYSVTQRTREIGIRMALGAQPRDVLGIVFHQGMRMVGIGVALGIAAGAVVSRALRSLLFGLSPFDPIAYVSVSLFLAAVALLACYLPARRATKVDPLTALRHE